VWHHWVSLWPPPGGPRLELPQQPHARCWCAAAHAPPQQRLRLRQALHRHPHRPHHHHWDWLRCHWHPMATMVWGACRGRVQGRGAVLLLQLLRRVARAAAALDPSCLHGVYEPRAPRGRAYRWQVRIGRGSAHFQGKTTPRAVHVQLWIHNLAGCENALQCAERTSAHSASCHP